MADPLTQARDRIAELCGYVCKFDEQRYDETWFDGDVLLDHHPIPASLDFVSKVWPNRWDWSYGSTPVGGWEYAACGASACLSIQMGDSELADRMTLLADVLAWLQSNDPPAFDAAVEKIRKEIGQ